MIELGQHAGFIITAYVGVFSGLFALIGWSLYDSRRISRRLARLEGRKD